jgi:hypothetical protein
MQRAGVVTCLVIDDAELDTSVGDVAHEALVRLGAVVVVPSGDGLVGAFRRMTDALRAVLELRTQLPASRLALCAGETGSRGEFGSIADKATRLMTDAEPGSTLLSKLAGVLAMDHLPSDRTLFERCERGDRERCFELRNA